MATATPVPPSAVGDAFKKELFSKEVQGWLGRATPEERERFECVFESIRSISEAKKAPDAHATFVRSTLSKMRQNRGTVSAGPKVRTPPLPRGSTAAVCNGWSYTATRTAFDTRPETRAALAALQEQAAAAALEYQKRQGAELLADISCRPQSAALLGPTAGATASSAATASGSALSSADRELTTLQIATAARKRVLSGEGGGTGDGALTVTGTKPTSSHSALVVTPSHAVAPAPPNPANPSPRSATLSPAKAGTSREGTGFVAPGPNTTAYQDSYALRSTCPEAYDQALKYTRAELAPNTVVNSEWGNSLKAGAAEEQKLYMHTTYNTLNDTVVKLKTDADETREREFFKWMQRQKTFYGDLLAPAKAADLDAVMAGASDDQKRDILQVLRTTHAAVDTCFDRTRSHSQAVHCDMRRVEDERVEAMRRALTKARTMGQPMVRKSPGKRRPATAMPASGLKELKPTMVNITMGSSEGSDGRTGSGTKALQPSRRPATATAALGRARSAAPHIPPPLRADGLERSETFKSKIPLTWPSGHAGPDVSTYIETFAGGKIGAGSVRPASALYKPHPIRYTDTTCPYGAVDPHTAAVPARPSYPVPESFTIPGVSPFPAPMGTTSYRTEFTTRDQADAVVQARAAAALAESSRKLLERGTVPMGPRMGANILPSANWISETRETYHEHNVDLRDPYERAQAMKTMFTGPTASGGKLTLAGPNATAGKA